MWSSPGSVQGGMAVAAPAVSGIPAAGMFAGMDARLLQLLSAAGGSRQLTAAPGQVLMRVGECEDSLYVLDSGVVEVVKEVGSGQHPFLRVMCGPNYFGEACALGLRQARTATVRAATECRVRVVLGHILRSLLRCFPREQLCFLQEAKARLSSLAAWECPAQQRLLTPFSISKQGFSVASITGSATSFSQGSSSATSCRPSDTAPSEQGGLHMSSSASNSDGRLSATSLPPRPSSMTSSRPTSSDGSTHSRGHRDAPDQDAGRYGARVHAGDAAGLHRPSQRGALLLPWAPAEPLAERQPGLGGRGRAAAASKSSRQVTDSCSPLGVHDLGPPATARAAVRRQSFASARSSSCASSSSREASRLGVAVLAAACSRAAAPSVAGSHWKEERLHTGRGASPAAPRAVAGPAPRRAAGPRQFGQEQGASELQGSASSWAGVSLDSPELLPRQLGGVPAVPPSSPMRRAGSWRMIQAQPCDSVVIWPGLQHGGGSTARGRSLERSSSSGSSSSRSSGREPLFNGGEVVIYPGVPAALPGAVPNLHPAAASGLPPSGSSRRHGSPLHVGAKREDLTVTPLRGV